MRKNKKTAEGLFLFRYTFSAWQKRFPKSSYKEWEKATHPYSISDFVMERIVSYLMRKENKKCEDLYDSLKEIKIVTLGEKFLKDYGVKHFSELQYKKDLSDEELEKTMIDSEMNKDYVLCMIVCSVPQNTNHNFNPIMDKVATDSIRKYLSGVYGEGNVYFPGYILAANEAGRLKNELLKKADIYFCDSSYTLPGVFENAKSCVTFLNRHTMVLPFVVKGAFTKPIINMEQWNEFSTLTSPSDIFLDKNSLGKIGVNSCGINDTNIPALLCKHLNTKEICINPQVAGNTFF